LLKPGKLDADEWEIMKSHTLVGYNILKTSNSAAIKAAAMISAQHHEKWDESGYPHGLKANNIHIYSRITAIADVFDALGNDRPYKKAWELDKIFELFEQEKGKHFDPWLTDAFLNNRDKFINIKNLYS
jgi:response regulator RpfG family c-di-GMP phosphodiesterase